MTFLLLKTKYGNKPSLCAKGHSHRSALESNVCALIQLRERAGEVKLIQAEKKIYLSDARIGYICDFACEDMKTGLPLHIEAKGFANDRWPIIKKLWAAYGPSPLEIWMQNRTGPYLDELIIPKAPAECIRRQWEKKK